MVFLYKVTKATIKSSGCVKIIKIKRACFHPRWCCLYCLTRGVIEVSKVNTDKHKRLKINHKIAQYFP